MAIFTISDLHLSLSVDKPMNIFGSAWDNYMERIECEWNRLVCDGDVVFIGGDVSWAMHLEECFKDFEFINSLKGSKVILKGNHDYWWESITKMNRYLSDNSFSTIQFLNNNAVLTDEYIVCGSRGWILPGDSGFTDNDRKIYERELQRLELSFADGAARVKKSGMKSMPTVCILHYPPFTRERSLDDGIASLFKKYGVCKCFYGHLHSRAAYGAVEGLIDQTEYKLVSADYIKFTPHRI